MDLIKKAVIDFTRIFSYLKGNRMWFLIIISGIIGFSIGAVTLYVAYRTGAYMADVMTSLYPFEFGKRAASTFFHLIPITYVLAIMLVKYLIYVIVSPFMSALSEMIEYKHLQEAYVPKPQNTLRLIRRTGRIAFRSLYKEILWTLLFSIAGILVPVVGVAGILIAQSYYIGSAHLDYTLARKMSYSDMRKWMLRNRGLALGNGAIYFTLLFIPVLGLLAAPVLTTAAGTLSTLDVIALEGGDKTGYRA